MQLLIYTLITFLIYFPNKVESQYTCTICLSNEEENITGLGCKHSFHFHCIVDWIIQNNVQNANCPECREVIDTNTQLSLSNKLLLQLKSQSSRLQKQLDELLKQETTPELIDQCNNVNEEIETHFTKSNITLNRIQTLQQIEFKFQKLKQNELKERMAFKAKQYQDRQKQIKEQQDRDREQKIREERLSDFANRL
jgi:hypothetical protein